MTDPDAAHEIFAVWRDWSKTTEATWSQMLSSWTQTDAFTEGLTRTLDNYLLTHRTFSNAMQEYMQQVLRTMNIASSADLTRMTELVINLENKVDNLADEIDGLSFAEQWQPVEERLSAVERKLDRLGRAEQLRSIELQLTDVQRKLEALTNQHPPVPGVESQPRGQ